MQEPDCTALQCLHPLLTPPDWKPDRVAARRRPSHPRSMLQLQAQQLPSPSSQQPHLVSRQAPGAVRPLAGGARAAQAAQAGNLAQLALVQLLPRYLPEEASRPGGDLLRHKAGSGRRLGGCAALSALSCGLKVWSRGE